MRSSPRTTPTQAALTPTHQYNRHLSLMVRAFAHGAESSSIRDYDPEANKNNVWLGMLRAQRSDHQPPELVSLFPRVSTPWASTSTTMWSWPSRTPEKQILVEPASPQFVQASSGKSCSRMDCLPVGMPTGHLPPTAWPKLRAVWLPGWMEAINFGNQRCVPARIGPGGTSFFTNATPLDCHTTTLILWSKGALDARVQVDC